MNVKIILVVVGLLFLVGCYLSSSYDDCMMDCKYNIAKKDICTDVGDLWDGCTDEEAQQVKEFCFNKCTGNAS